jgi:hypothetical protein
MSGKQLRSRVVGVGSDMETTSDEELDLQCGQVVEFTEVASGPSVVVDEPNKGCEYRSSRASNRQGVYQKSGYTKY